MKKGDCICGITSSLMILSGSILMIGNFYSGSFLTGSLVLGSGILFSITYMCKAALQKTSEEKERLIS